MKDFSNYNSDVFSCSIDNQTAIISLKEECYKIANPEFSNDVSHVFDLLDCINSL